MNFAPFPFPIKRAIFADIRMVLVDQIGVQRFSVLLPILHIPFMEV